MPGKSIGVTMNAGYPGSFARNGDCIIMNRPVKSTDSNNIAFGSPVILNSDNTYSAGLATLTATNFAGVAVREVKQSVDYYNPAGAYKPGEPADVIERGNVSVVCNVGTPTSGGAVYVRITANGSIPAGVVGGFEAAADGSNTVQLTNCKWATGIMDANKVTELSILNRINP